jgi:hypothetical protein
MDFDSSSNTLSNKYHDFITKSSNSNSINLFEKKEGEISNNKAENDNENIVTGTIREDSDLNNLNPQEERSNISNTTTTFSSQSNISSQVIEEGNNNNQDNLIIFESEKKNNCKINFSCPISDENNFNKNLLFSNSIINSLKNKYSTNNSSVNNSNISKNQIIDIKLKEYHLNLMNKMKK